MRAAPPVSVRCAEGPAWRGVQLLLPALAAAVAVGWALRSLELVDSTPVLLAASALAGLVAVFASGRGLARGVVDLAWDGERWSAGGEACRAELMIDLGRWLLLRLQPELGGLRRARWVDVDRATAGPAFHALRVALYARRPPAEAGTDSRASA